VGIVLATRDRRASVLRTIDRLRRLDERPAIVLVDNGSTDGTAAAVRATFAGVDVVELGGNHAAAARNAGARRLDCPYVAFCDDDSWWAPGALPRAADVLDAHPRLALVAARVLVGEEERLDPVCEAMARSPLPRAPGAPGPAILGFVACGAVVRRDALLDAGGFDRRYGVGGEEQPLALSLAAAGWQLAYRPDVVAHHHPATGGRAGRTATVIRNDMWSAWLRRPVPAALRVTARVVVGAARRPVPLAKGLAAALAGTPWVVRERRVLPEPVERAVRVLERAG